MPHKLSQQLTDVTQTRIVANLAKVCQELLHAHQLVENGVMSISQTEQNSEVQG